MLSSNSATSISASPYVQVNPSSLKSTDGVADSAEVVTVIANEQANRSPVSSPPVGLVPMLKLNVLVVSLTVVMLNVNRFELNV